MSKLASYQLVPCRTLIIPDVHQKVAWVRAILEREEGNWEQLVFLGDYFDSFDRPPIVASVTETAKFLLEIRARYGGRVTSLLGNHDIPYMELLEMARPRAWVPFPQNACMGFEAEKAIEVAAVLKPEFRASCRLFVECNGFLLSHAGVHPSFWREDLPGVADPLAALDELCTIAMEYLGKQRLAILGCGAARGGPMSIGGITWLDWDEEFEDDPRLPPQVVGHTPALLGARRNGRSWCIDGGQTCYAILDGRGNLEVRSLPGEG